MMNSNLHHPPHVYIDNSWYFITAHTFGPEFPLKNHNSKRFWLEKLRELAKQFDIKIYANVLLDNHYHLMGFIPDSRILAKFIHRLHGATSYYINKIENRSGRKIWHNYWDRIIRDENEFYTKFNYIHYNPVKIGYVSDLKEWEFSSYNNYLSNKGEEWIQDCWRTYPIREYNFED